MRRRLGSRLRALGIATLFALPTREARAQSLPEFPACIAAGDQSLTCVASDGMGGSFLVWRDDRGADADVFVLRTTPAGLNAPGWPADGVAVCPAPGDQFAARAVADSRGGAFLVWEDEGSGASDIRAVRLDEFGRVYPGWPAGGRLVCGAPGAQHEPVLCSDGSDGVFIVWSDHRTPLDADIAIQHLDADGHFPSTWRVDGELLCDVTGMQFSPALVSDGAGGVVVVWEDWRGGLEADVYTQRVYANLHLAAWGLNGRPVCTAVGDQQSPSLAPDGTGGAYFVWQDLRGAYYDIYVLRILGDGTIEYGWPLENGMALCTSAGGQFSPQIVSDGNQGAIVTWFDARNGGYDVYAQKITAHGAFGAGWNGDGLALCTQPGDQLYPQLVADGAGGAFATWTDRRRPGDADIYMTRILPDGTTPVDWPAGGVTVCNAVHDQAAPLLAYNGRGGAVLAWTDARSGTGRDVYATRIERISTHEYPAWTANGAVVCDAPGDQVSATAPFAGCAATADGTGGAFVVWQDASGSGGGGLCAQRLDAMGSPASGWPPEGVRLSDVRSVQENASLTEDGQGGLIVVWQDGRDAGDLANLYAQRLTSSGALAPGWPAAGVRVCVAARHQLEPRVASDGQGGAYFAWRDGRNGQSDDVYAVRLSANSGLAVGWPMNGRAFCAAVGDQRSIDIAADGRGEMHLAWVDHRVSIPRLYTTHVNPSGAVTVGFPPDGLRGTTVCRPLDVLRLLPQSDGGAVMLWLDSRRGGRDLYANRLGPVQPSPPMWGDSDVWLGPAGGAATFEVASDGFGGVFAAWTPTSQGVANVIAQHVRSDGSIAPGWPGVGQRVAPSPRPQLFASIASDGAGGAYFAWVDVRNGEPDIYAQQLRDDGSFGADGGWGGIPVCNAIGAQVAPRVVSEISGSAIVAWHDARTGGMDVYAARIGPRHSATGVEVGFEVAPLLRGLPNPFRAATRLELAVPARDAIHLEIFDVAGRRVKAWTAAPSSRARQRIDWDGRDAGGASVAAGTYFVRLRTGEIEAKAKLVRAR